jgi:hypothetical protein
MYFNHHLGCKYFTCSFHTIKIVNFQRYSMEFACILIILMCINILDARFTNKEIITPAGFYLALPGVYCKYKNGYRKD